MTLHTSTWKANPVWTGLRGRYFWEQHFYRISYILVINRFDFMRWNRELLWGKRENKVDCKVTRPKVSQVRSVCFFHREFNDWSIFVAAEWSHGPLALHLTCVFWCVLVQRCTFSWCSSRKCACGQRSSQAPGRAGRALACCSIRVWPGSWASRALENFLWSWACYFWPFSDCRYELSVGFSDQILLLKWFPVCKAVLTEHGRGNTLLWDFGAERWPCHAVLQLIKI